MTPRGNVAARLDPRLCACATGVASGIVLVRSRSPIAGLSATIGDLRQRGAAEVLSARQLQVRYAAKEGAKSRFRPDNGMRGEGGRIFYDYLVTTAPDNALSVPIWLDGQGPSRRGTR